jgi:hypothetical protein
VTEESLEIQIYGGALFFFDGVHFVENEYDERPSNCAENNPENKGVVLKAKIDEFVNRGHGLS